MDRKEIEKVLTGLNIPIDTNTERFDYRLSKSDAEKLVAQNIRGVEVMCKEYGLDSTCEGVLCPIDDCTCWNGITIEDLHDDDEEGVFVFDDDYKTFEIWV